MSLVARARVMFYTIDHRQVGCELSRYNFLAFHCMALYLCAMLTFICLAGAICFVISIGHIYLGVFCITDRDRGWDIEVLLTMSKETSCTAIYALGFLFPTTIDC